MTTHSELGLIVVDWIREHPESADMPFNSFLEEINKLSPCGRPKLSVTMTLLTMTGQIQVKANSKGCGFALARETAPILSVIG